MNGTRTDDGQLMSLLFDSLHVESAAADLDIAPQVKRAEGLVQCEGQGWVSVQLRGAMLATGGHGYAHAMAWANRRRLRVAGGAPNEPFSASVAAPVGSDGRLRLSLLLLAQRDLGSEASAAACWLDSLDIAVLPAAEARGRS
jgi:hypothetical protein